MVLKGNKIPIGSSRQCIITKLWFLLLITTLSFLYAQPIGHEVPLWQKDNTGVKEIKVFRDSELVGLRQFRTEGETAFQMVRNVNSKTEHTVHFYTTDGDIKRSILATSRSGFFVFREQKLGKIRKHFINHTFGYNMTDLDKNTFLSQVRNIRDSMSLMAHKKVRLMLDESPHLTQIDHFDDDGKKLKSYQYHKGKLIGIAKKIVRADDTEQLVKPDGTPAGLSIEREDNLVVSTKTINTEDFFGYNKDKKLVSHTTYRQGKLQYATTNRYDGDKLVHRKFENLDAKNKKENEYFFHYDEKGKLSSIVKHDGKETATFNYEYSYW